MDQNGSLSVVFRPGSISESVKQHLVAVTGLALARQPRGEFEGLRVSFEIGSRLHDG